MRLGEGKSLGPHSIKGDKFKFRVKPRVLHSEMLSVSCCPKDISIDKKKTRKHLSKPILQSSHLFVLKSLRPTFLWFHKFPQLQSFCHKEARRGSLGWKQKQQFFVKNFGEKLPVFCTCVYLECAHFM